MAATKKRAAYRIEAQQLAVGLFVHIQVQGAY